MRYYLENRCKAKRFDGRALDKNYRVERKYDGHRVSVIKEGNNPVRVVRNLIHLDFAANLVHPSTQWIHKLPSNTVVECELYVPGKPAPEVSTELSLLYGSKSLRLMPFAVPFHCGANHGRSSYYTLAMRDEIMRELDLTPPANLRQSFQPSELTIEEFWQQLASNLSWEGVVIKESAYMDWHKIKPYLEFDGVVMEAIPGKGKYKGMHGALIIGVYKGEHLIEVCSVAKGGGNDDWRTKDWIGKVVEVQYEEIQAKGGLKFSRFSPTKILRERDDKLPEECRIEQL